MATPATISIAYENIPEMAAVVAALVKEGLIVTVHLVGGDWKILVTGY